MDEGARLESVWTGNRLVSSNLTLSAIFLMSVFNDCAIVKNFDCARRGGSGALLPANRYSGVEFLPQGLACGVRHL